MNIDELKELREQVELAEKEKIRLETLLNSYIEELKNIGVENMVEAEKILNEKREKVEILESRKKKLEEELNQLISEYDNGK